MTAQELLDRYATGERDFAGVDLHGIDLSGAILCGINFDRADLSNANFKGADLSGDYNKNFSRQFKRKAGVSIYPGGYSSIGLGLALGGYSCIRYAVLRNANFQDANLSYVDFSRSDLSFANLGGAYGEGISFEYACLSWAKLNPEIGISSFEGANVEGTILENAEWV